MYEDRSEVVVGGAAEDGPFDSKAEGSMVLKPSPSMEPFLLLTREETFGDVL